MSFKLSPINRLTTYLPATASSIDTGLFAGIPSSAFLVEIVDSLDLNSLG